MGVAELHFKLDIKELFEASFFFLFLSLLVWWTIIPLYRYITSRILVEKVKLKMKEEEKKRLSQEFGEPSDLIDYNIL
jgi:hypothetical protein